MKRNLCCTQSRTNHIIKNNVKATKEQIVVDYSHGNNFKEHITLRQQAWGNQIKKYHQKHQLNLGLVKMILKVEIPHKVTQIVHYQKNNLSTSRDLFHMNFQKNWKLKWAKLFNFGQDLLLLYAY